MESSKQPPTESEKMITRDIKQLTIKRLLFIESGLEPSSEQWYQIRELIDSLSSDSVSIEYSRPEFTSRPGDIEDSSELFSRNID